MNAFYLHRPLLNPFTHTLGGSMSGCDLSIQPLHEALSISDGLCITPHLSSGSSCRMTCFPVFLPLPLDCHRPAPLSLRSRYKRSGLRASLPLGSFKRPHPCHHVWQLHLLPTDRQPYWITSCWFIPCLPSHTAPRETGTNMHVAHFSLVS